MLRHPESVPLLQANVSVFRNRVKPGYIDSAVVGLQWPLGCLVRRPFHPDHLVIGLSGTKRDHVISDAETSSALAQEVEIWSSCAGLDPFQFAITPESKLNGHWNAIMPSYIERKFKNASVLTAEDWLTNRNAIGSFPTRDFSRASVWSIDK